MQAMQGSMTAMDDGSGTVIAPWWMAAEVTPYAAYAAKGAASLVASYVNLANAGFKDLTLGSAPGWDATNGWTGAAGKFLKTGIIPTTSWTTLVRFSGSSVVNQYPFGAYKTTPTTIYASYPRDGNSRRVYYNGTSPLLIGAPSAVASGVLCVAGQTGYYNGNIDGTIPSAADTGLEMYIMALNNAGTAILNFTGSVQAFITFDSTLVQAKVQALTTSMLAI